MAGKGREALALFLMTDMMAGIKKAAHVPAAFSRLILWSPTSVCPGL